MGDVSSIVEPTPSGVDVTTTVPSFEAGSETYAADAASTFPTYDDVSASSPRTTSTNTSDGGGGLAAASRWRCETKREAAHHVTPTASNRMRK